MEKQTKPLHAGPPPVMSRRTFLKKGVGWGAALAAGMVLGGGYATGIEPRWLEVVRTRLTLPALPQAFRGVTVAHFSDVHFGFFFGLDRLEELILRIQEEKPDMICFTGDLVDDKVGGQGPEMSKLLSQLKAPLGKYAVLGNHDYYDDESKVEKILTNGGFRCLRNESVTAAWKGSRIRIAGVEDIHRGLPDMNDALRASKEGEFVLLLSHTPDYAATALSHPVHLQLSGHSHGGQIRLPIKGPLKLVPGAMRYPIGWYSLEGGKLQLYVTRGIGVTGLPIRFLCRPELTVHTLV